MSTDIMVNGEIWQKLPMHNPCTFYAQPMRIKFTNVAINGPFAGIAPVDAPLATGDRAHRRTLT